MSEILLAIDWSSTRLSVAWKQDGKIEEQVLELKRFQAEVSLPFLEAFIRNRPEPAEIRIGRGPGNYSGIRQSLAWAFGYCAPGKTELKVFSSGVAQAERIAKVIDTPFAILGDARRGVWWGRIFGMEQESWQLNPPEIWAGRVDGIPVYSQEAARLSSAAFAVKVDFPTAADLLQLPDDFPGEPALPLYLHPPV